MKMLIPMRRSVTKVVTMESLNIKRWGPAPEIIHLDISRILLYFEHAAWGNINSAPSINPIGTS